MHFFSKWGSIYILIAANPIAWLLANDVNATTAIRPCPITSTLLDIAFDLRFDTLNTILLSFFLDKNLLLYFDLQICSLAKQQITLQRTMLFTRSDTAILDFILPQNLCSKDLKNYVVEMELTMPKMWKIIFRPTCCPK